MATIHNIADQLLSDLATTMAFTLFVMIVAAVAPTLAFRTVRWLRDGEPMHSKTPNQD